MNTNQKQNWFDIWSKRRLDLSKTSLMDRLLAVDGMDTKFGAMTESAWLEYIQRISNTLEITDLEHSILDLGCGGGAFLYPFYQKGHQVSGIDQSSALIEIAHTYLPRGDFSRGFADNFSAKPADFVVSSAVFLYFPDTQYAQNVLRNMATHALKAIAILDIPNHVKKQQAESERRAMMPKHEYEQKYEGLEHLYYKKEWFIEHIKQLNFSKVLIEDQAIKGYKNAEHRFNVFAWK